MTTTEIYDPQAANGAGEMIAPTQSLSVAETARTTAEVQSALTIAAARPRNERQCIDRIMTACQRLGLAAISQYAYSKGGTNITGPSIHLLTTVATNWGNIQFGFRELAQGRGESTVEAYAWDMQTNTRRSLTFVVPHRIGLKGGKTKPLTDPRDIYEWVANQAQRRVRSCLENVIPRDVIDDAVEECTKTLHSKADTSPEALKKMVATFETVGVTKAQIEARIQRRIDAIAPAQVISLRRIYTSIKDGMSTVEDWFEPEAEDGGTGDLPQKQSAKDKVKAQAEKAKHPEAKDGNAFADAVRDHEAKEDEKFMK